MKYGQNTQEVEAFIEDIKKLTPEQFRKYAADADAADAAYAAAADAAYAAAADAAYAAAAAAVAYATSYAVAYAADADAADAAYYFRRQLRRAAFALAIKHLIGLHGFTQSHYDTLTAVCSVIKAGA